MRALSDVTRNTVGQAKVDLDVIAKRFDALVTDLKLTDPKQLRAAFVLAVMLNCGGSFNARFLSFYS